MYITHNKNTQGTDLPIQCLNNRVLPNVYCAEFPNFIPFQHDLCYLSHLESCDDDWLLWRRQCAGEWGGVWGKWGREREWWGVRMWPGYHRLQSSRPFSRPSSLHWVFVDYESNSASRDVVSVNHTHTTTYPQILQIITESTPVNICCNTWCVIAIVGNVYQYTRNDNKTGCGIDKGTDGRGTSQPEIDQLVIVAIHHFQEQLSVLHNRYSKPLKILSWTTNTCKHCPSTRLST